MKIKFFTIIIAIFIALQTSVFAQKSAEFIVVSDQMTTCEENEEAKCLQIKKPHETNWRTYSGQIENFRFAEGYFYLLEVNRVYRKAITGGDDFHYRVKRILSREKSATNRNASLGETKWILDKIEGEAVKTDRAFVTFEPEKERFGGNGGCNGMGGNLKVEGSEIEMSEIISTKMYCEGLSEIENQFFANLEAANRFVIKDRRLYLYRNNNLLLEFRAG